MHLVNLFDNPWCFALLIGGFAYFNEKGKAVCVNALTIVPSPAGEPGARGVDAHATTASVARRHNHHLDA